MTEHFSVRRVNFKNSRGDSGACQSTVSHIPSCNKVKYRYIIGHLQPEGQTPPKASNIFCHTAN